VIVLLKPLSLKEQISEMESTTLLYLFRMQEQSETTDQLWLESSQDKEKWRVFLEDCIKLLDVEQKQGG
jgi:hypothetical protein